VPPQQLSLEEVLRFAREVYSASYIGNITLTRISEVLERGGDVLTSEQDWRAAVRLLLMYCARYAPHLLPRYLTQEHRAVLRLLGDRRFRVRRNGTPTYVKLNARNLSRVLRIHGRRATQLIRDLAAAGLIRIIEVRETSTIVHYFVTEGLMG